MSRYSWWIVPQNYPKIMRDFDIFHIPHITIKNNMSYPRPHRSIGMEIPLKYGKVFKGLHGWGVECHAMGWGKYTMTIEYYSHSDGTGIPAYEWPSIGIFCCADKTSNRPRDWRVITERMSCH